MTQTEKMAAIENVADPKIIADGKIMAELNIMANPKILADEEIPAAREKSLQALKSPRPWKSRRNWKSKRPAYCLGSAEPPTADFSLVPLMSTFCSSMMWWILHVVSKWGLVSWCPAFMGRFSPVLYRCLYQPAMPRNGPNPRSNQKSGFRLKFHWFLSNHKNSISAYKCPNTEPKNRFFYIIIAAVQYQLSYSWPPN